MTNDPPAVASKASVDLESESVAGEDDPGASMDMPPAGQEPAAVPGGTETVRPDAGAVLNPGDDAAPGTPGTGEALCRACGGSGRLGGTPCAACGGTGKVVAGMGGG
ncbi:MAG: hypothetical protein JWQ72_1370 [Polaromonas sp.]|nr:hypothetical protein [Polaromonas sp.]